MPIRIITLLLNPAYDVTVECEQFLLRAENREVSERFDAGGKAINVSRVLKSAGVGSTAIILAGEDNLPAYIEKLNQEDITAVIIREKGRIRENISIRTPDGSITRLMRSGFTFSTQNLDEIKRILRQNCLPGCFCVISGSIPPGMSEDQLEEICTYTRSRGAKLILDTRSLGLKRLLRLKPYIIKPNLEEFEMLTGNKGLSRSEQKKIALTFIENGIENILLSLGSEGMMYISTAGAYFAEVPKICPISAVGAGDSSLAGFLLAINNEDLPDKRLRLAAAFGTAACLTEGTNPPHPQDIQAIYQQIRVTLL